MEDNIFLNIVSSSDVKTSGINKKEKKEKYLEKKMLTNKRKREKDHIKKENKKKENAPSDEKVEKSEEIYDELKEFYDENQKNNLQRYTPKERKDTQNKKRELEKEIQNEFKEIKEENILEEQKKHEQKNSVFSVKTFDDLDINQYLKKTLTKNNYTTMTKIQKKSIPILLKHKNVVMKSETGSGKTLAYVIPLYEYLYKLNLENKIDRKDGIYSIIFAPTHELCMQIEETFNKLKSACINVVYGSLMGGQKIEREKQKLRKGLNVIITTPGRLLYHLKNTLNIKFDKLKLLIFDEADRLLDMGFEREIKACMTIIAHKINPVSLNQEPNTEATVDENTELNSEQFKKLKIFLISATVENKIRSLCEYLMKGFKTVGFDLKTEEDHFEAPSGLTQYYAIINDEFRLLCLLAFLFNHVDKKIMVFTSTCDSADFLTQMLSSIEYDENFEKGIEERLEKSKNKPPKQNNKYSNNKQEDNTPTPTADKVEIKKTKLINAEIHKLHGKMDHAQRKEIFKKFNLEKPGILVATDVAARGLDFPMVDWIIHYDINPSPKEYLNRMGRTARINQVGNSLVFMMKHETKILDSCLSKFTLNEMKSGKILLEFAKKLNETIHKKIQYVPYAYKDEVDENEKFRKKYFFAIHPLQSTIKSYLFVDRDNLVFARKAFKSSVRAYVQFHKNDKDIFNVKNLNLTRYARSFGLYKESSKMKIGDQEMMIDYEVERNNTRSYSKFNNKKMERKLIVSEFE